MTPVGSNPQVLVLRDLAEARAALKRIRVSGAGIEIMEKKALFRVVRVRGLDIRAANILKQEMLSRGGEVATSREVYELHGENADCLIMGTLTQYERAAAQAEAAALRAAQAGGGDRGGSAELRRARAGRSSRPRSERRPSAHGRAQRHPGFVLRRRQLRGRR